MDNKEKQFKEQWKKDFGELTCIVNEWDPMGLIRGGAPDDEFESLTMSLLSKLYQGKNRNELESFIIERLKEEFDLDILNLKEEYKRKSLDKIKSTCMIIEQWFREKRKHL